MHTHSDVVLEFRGPNTEDLLINNGDFTAPSLAAVNNQQPAKRTTRQWAAWTRQEEENFFNALRQVGKNFEKITCRVQSKNKNQVRHYYYRLVRRMNKLLGPALCLDAKNSKDTNAAMLRWWSLLEKHSCTASKLHLKPRRFKIFLEALESQLLKDRNKSRRKRPGQGEKYSSSASAASVSSKEIGSDGHQILDVQNAQKLEATKGPSLKRNTSVNINFGKGGLPPKPARQKRRPAGLVASAAYRRWEKAAIAGVSLVADAAEQLERATASRNYPTEQGTFVMLSNGAPSNAGEKESVGKNQVHLCSTSQERVCVLQAGETVMQPPVKLKLQLFPIDEVTRQSLEKDACNPYLELTLSGRKRISSVLEHLNRKWGSLPVASGELVLLPYSSQPADVQRRWTIKDTISSTSDVYAAVGSPAAFRMRYGWFTDIHPGVGSSQVPSPLVHHGAAMQSEDFQEGLYTDVPNREIPHIELSSTQASKISEQPVGSFRGLSANVTSHSNIREPGQTSSSFRKLQEVSLEMTNYSTLSPVDWADSLTNISVGDLFSEASNAAKCSYVDSSPGKSTPFSQENTFSCDSFDAAIAAHISNQQESGVSPHVATSMWNAEETCDEFSFRAAPTLKNRESRLSRCFEDHEQAVVSDSSFQGYFKELTNSRSLARSPEAQLESTEDVSHSVSLAGPCERPEAQLEPAKDVSHEHNNESDGLTRDMNLLDIYWPDSLGPLDLEMPSSCRYQAQDLVFGDSNSFGCLNRMISNSVDAFQNFSFFGTDKRESSGETHGASTNLDSKFF